MAHFFGTDEIAFSAPSDFLPGVLRSFTSLSQAAEEAGQSRIYGGIHWQYDNQGGLEERAGARRLRILQLPAAGHRRREPARRTTPPSACRPGGSGSPPAGPTSPAAAGLPTPSPRRRLGRLLVLQPEPTPRSPSRSSTPAAVRPLLGLRRRAHQRRGPAHGHRHPDRQGERLLQSARPRFRPGPGHRRLRHLPLIASPPSGSGSAAGLPGREFARSLELWAQMR